MNILLLIIMLAASPSVIECTSVRAALKLYTAEQVEAFARARGMSEAAIARGKLCLKPKGKWR